MSLPDEIEVTVRITDAEAIKLFEGVRRKLGHNIGAHELIMLGLQMVTHEDLDKIACHYTTDLQTAAKLCRKLMLLYIYERSKKREVGSWNMTTGKFREILASIKQGGHVFKRRRSKEKQGGE